MPIILGLFSLGALAVVNLTTKSNGDSILTPADTAANSSPIPSWIIPTVIVAVGGLLLYKEGAKLLKL